MVANDGIANNVLTQVNQIAQSIMAEVAKAYLHHRRDPPIFFWRDRTGHEVDLLVDEAGALFPIEIKSGQTIARDMLKGIVWWSRQAGQDPGHGTLVHGGADRYARDGIAVRPWFSV